MRTIAALVGIAGLLYGLLAMFVYLMQERMVFLPNLPGRALAATPRDAGFDYEEIRLATSDAVTLHGWFVPADRSRGTLLFFHGNAGNISHRLDSIAIFHALGLDVLIVDYRGYGQSEGKASEPGLYRDGRAAWRYLVEDRGIEPGRIIVFGRSLGGAVAANLAAEVDPAGVIIESSFTSAANIAARLYPFLPARLLLRLKFPVADTVRRIDAPLLVIHSRDDEIIPYAMGREIFEAAAGPKAFLELRGDHNSAFLLETDRYVAGLRRFVDTHLVGETGAEPATP